MEILGKIFGQVPSAGRLNSLRTAEHRPTSVCRSARFAVCLSLAMLISPVWLVAQGTLGKLTLLDAPVLAIDDSGTVVLQFRNDGRSNVNLALTASEIANAAGKRSNAKVVLKTVADLDGKTLVETKEVPPGNCLYVLISGNQGGPSRELSVCPGRSQQRSAGRRLGIRGPQPWRQNRSIQGPPSPSAVCRQAGCAGLGDAGDLPPEWRAEASVLQKRRRQGLPGKLGVVDRW